MRTDNYTVKSLELHLFFGRIMKEHSLFLEAGFTPADPSFSGKAEYYKKGFENLLCDATELGNGVVSRELLSSGELVTEFTAKAEKQTEDFTGISINKEITAREMRMCPGRCGDNTAVDDRQIKRLNQRALELLDGLISFKECILENVLKCKMFTANYPLLLEHVIREAKLYRGYVEMLERDGSLSDTSMFDTECFWNRIMMEHAMFIRGLLDPSETDLIIAADDFACSYSELLEKCRCAHNRTLSADSSLEETLKFRDFKSAGARGITSCEIRSIILPLLADHVLREANHYIRLLSV